MTVLFSIAQTGSKQGSALTAAPLLALESGRSTTARDLVPEGWPAARRA
jgi:hypothetical protein